LQDDAQVGCKPADDLQQQRQQVDMWCLPLTYAACVQARATNSAAYSCRTGQTGRRQHALSMCSCCEGSCCLNMLPGAPGCLHLSGAAAAQ
jgi:hypothetical protein